MNKGELNILIVDDDEEDILLAEDLLREGLKGVSLELDRANSFAEGLSLAQKAQYDLILLDYQLGERNGLELMCDVRAKGIDTPIVFLTGRGDEEIAAQAMKLGATDYLPKSKLTENLARRTVRYAIELHEKETLQMQAEEELRKRNSELQRSVQELARLGRESFFLNNLTNILNTCVSVDEVYALIARHISDFFPGQSGALCIFDATRTMVEAVSVWGNSPPNKREFTPEECWGLRRGRLYGVEDSRAEIICPHLNGSSWISYFCVPLIAYGEILGVLILEGKGAEARVGPCHVSPFQSQGDFARSVAEHLALALANLKLREALREQALRDPLTGLFNRRYLEEFMERALSSASRHRRPVSVLLLDLDRFKDFNDSYGHEAGDKVLRCLAQFLTLHTRGEDIACRYGGEEFVLVLPEVPMHVALQRAEQLCAKAKTAATRCDFPWHSMPTFSVGVAAAPEHGYVRETLLRIADAALYQAKAQGRDRVAVGELAMSATGSSVHFA
jgi:diguanylate cyclase (GGDEF)-like protein